MRSHRHLRRIVGIATISIATAGVVGVATPGSASSLPAPKTIYVNASPHGLHVSASSVHASTYRIHYATSVPGEDGSSITMFSLRDGHTLAEVMRDVGLATGQDPKKAAIGIRRVNREINAIGGGDVLRGYPDAVTATLNRGTYYLVDMTSNVLRTLHVYGRTTATRAPSPDKIVTMFDNPAGEPRFYPTGTVFPRHGSVWLRNDTDELHFMTLLRVKPGTTDASLQHQFDLILAGKNPGPEAIIGPDAGTDVLSPGRQELLSYSLPAGRYVLICFIPDDETGLPHAFMGMHRIVTLK